MQNYPHTIDELEDDEEEDEEDEEDEEEDLETEHIGSSIDITPKINNLKKVEIKHEKPSLDLLEISFP